MIDRFVIGFLAGSAIFAALLINELGDAADQHTSSATPTRTDAPPTTSAQRPRVEELIRTALAQPLFSPSRRPPDRPTAAGPTDQLLNLRLTGIVVDPLGHLAIFAVPNGKPLARAEGEVVNEWRVESISANQVSLSGPNGITTLEPRADPNLIRPKLGQAAPPSARSAASRAAGPQPSPAAAPPGRAPNPDTVSGRRANPTRPQ